MRLLLLVLIALVAAVGAGHLLVQHPGFVVVGFEGKLVRTNLAFFVLCTLAASAAAYFLLRQLYRLLTMRGRWRRWRGEYRRRRAERTLNTGLLALVEGDYQQAERLLSRGAALPEAGAAHYLAAAQAAQALHAPERRDTYLRLAQDTAPAASLAVGIKRAELQLAQAQTAEAKAGLEALAVAHPKQRQVLALLAQACIAESDWNGLLRLLPDLRKLKALPAAQLEGIEQRLAEAVLSRPHAALAELTAVWRQLPRAVQERPGVLARYASQLLSFDQHDEVEGLLRTALTREWDSRLVTRYGRTRSRQLPKQLETAERWLAAHAADPELLLALGRLSLANQLWGKARSYLEELCALAPGALAHRLLAEAYEQLGDGTKAAQQRRIGLELATREGNGGAALVAIPKL